MKRKLLIRDIKGLFSIMSDAYNGNWKYRWGETPYFETDKNKKAESVNGHEWSCAFFWLALRRVCPALNDAVDVLKVYEICLTHDLGETHEGDVSRYQQLQGQGAHKHLSEREAIGSITKKTRTATSKEILEWFDEFEKKPEEIESLEILVVRFLDSLQGDHFALTFGHDLPLHSEAISKIVNMHTVSYARRLMEILEKTGRSEAREEVEEIFFYHIDQIESAGIILDKTGYSK